MSNWEPENMGRWVILLVMLLGVQTALGDLKMRTRETQRLYRTENTNPSTRGRPSTFPTPSRPSTATETPGRECPTPPPDEPWRYMYPFPGDCTKFYTCSNGQAVVEDCPQGTWFNNELEICDWPQHSGCVQPSPGTSSEAPTTTDGTTQPSNDTSTFTSTTHGQPSTSERPITTTGTTNTWPSPFTVTFTTPGRSSTSSTPRRPTTSTETPGRGCPTPPPDEPWRYMYPFPGDCTKFYTCSNGQAVVKDCPQGTWFNNELEICDWPQHSGCVQPTPETLEM